MKSVYWELIHCVTNAWLESLTHCYFT